MQGRSRQQLNHIHVQRSISLCHSVIEALQLNPRTKVDLRMLYALRYFPHGKQTCVPPEPDLCKHVCRLFYCYTSAQVGIVTAVALFSKESRLKPNERPGVVGASWRL